MFTFDEFRDAVIAGIKKLMKKKAVVIGDDEDLGDYGLDSLTSFGLVLEVESALGVDLGELDLYDANTIRLFYHKAIKTIEEAE